MGKIAPVSAKYLVNAAINIEGVVDKPDVIGAVFGQTEGLLGSDLELRELQRSGRIGRIEVTVNTSAGKTSGSILIPSSLDKAETAIVAAALEIIQRIGPCNAKVMVKNIEDVRVSKRNFVIERAKVLLKTMTENILPDSQELADEVAQTVRVMEIREFGKDRLAAGPNIEESEEIIVVEGRADVINLLKNGIKNGIAINGTSCPETVKELSKKKIVTILVDGDRGGDLIIKELLSVAEVDFVCKAPDGKEVEEITKKELHKVLRSKITAEQAKMDQVARPEFRRRSVQPPRKRYVRPRAISLKANERTKFKDMLDNLMGTRGATIFDQELNVLGRVPVTELNSTIKDVKGAYAIVLDGRIDSSLVRNADLSNVSFIVANELKERFDNLRVKVISNTDLT